MTGGNDANTTNASVQQASAAHLPLPHALPDLVRQSAFREADMDILANLDNVLDKTPEHAFACPPLPRRTIAAAAAEIRTLRAYLACYTSPGKTGTAAILTRAELFAGADGADDADGEVTP